MGGRGSKQRAPSPPPQVIHEPKRPARTSSTEGPRRGSGSAPEPSVTPVRPSTAPAQRPKTEFKGVVSFRDGPAAPKLELVSGRSDSLQSYGEAEVRNKGSDTVTVRASVRVRGGKWYFEMTPSTTGTISVGWCSKSFSGTSMLGTDAESWAFNGSVSDAFAMHKGEKTPFGRKWSAGSVIGVLLDCEKREMQFFINGTSCGAAFGGITIPDKGLYPAVTLTPSQRVKFEFGRGTYSHPQRSCSSLYSHLGPDGLARVEKLFEKYKAAGVAAGDSGDKDSLQPAGVTKLFETAGLDPDGMDMLLTQWKIGNQTPYEFMRIEVLAGMDRLECADEASLGKCIRKLRTGLKVDSDNFRDLYLWCFEYFKERPKSMGPDTAMVTWQVLFDGVFPLLNEWTTFIDEVKPAVNRDLWRMVLKFVIDVGGDLSRFDREAAWPSVLLEFVEKLEAQRAS